MRSALDMSTPATQWLIAVVVWSSTVFFPSCVANAAVGFPLRNGDFSNTCRTGSSRPLYDWNIINTNGAGTIDLEPTQPESFASSNILAFRTASGNGGIYQNVMLVPGQYQLVVDFKTQDNGQLQLRASDSTNTYESDDKWSQAALNFTVDKIDLVRVVLMSNRPGQVYLSSARIDVVSLASSPVDLEVGEPLAAIVIPKDANAAEKYAAYELQYYLAKMTGSTPGLVGRDEVHSGRRVIIGNAADPLMMQRLHELTNDSYIIDLTADQLTLAGNNDLGTLYAVYDFLRQQGCSWYMPGQLGEVVPTRQSLVLPDSRVESPDWKIRGFFNQGPHYNPNNAWEPIDIEACMDWVVRNRLNAAWLTYGGTVDLGAHRGHGYSVRTNHSWHKFWIPDGRKPLHSDWPPLVNGQRTVLHSSGRLNMPCTSNQALRDHTVEVIQKFFAEHPNAASFGLNADDEPANWCECQHCRSQDGDFGEGPWSISETGVPAISMTDRSLNYVNEVARRVSEIYPDKLIEMYSYGSLRRPPQHERVHPNVMIKYCYGPSSPLGCPLADRRFTFNNQVFEDLDAWQQAGTQHFGLYDYGNFWFPDTPWYWFYNIVDSLATFNDRWGVDHYLGENDNMFASSAVAYNLRARALWDTSIDYRSEVENICLGFYGSAGQAMANYHLFMDDVVQDYWHGRSTTPNEYNSLSLMEFNLADMARGKVLLDQAQSTCDDDITRHRVALVQFGHAYMTYALAQRTQPLTQQAVSMGIKAWNQAKHLRQQFRIMVSLSAVTPLEHCYFPPIIEETLQQLPIKWSFCTDPCDVGLEQQWYADEADLTWIPIRTDSAWTSQGHNYHGVAWYAIDLEIGPELRLRWNALRDRLAIHFGAVDGDAEVFLDGMRIGEQKLDVGFMWDKPFVIPLPNTLDPDLSHKLRVRVKKDMYAAGIWRPVSLVALPEQNDHNAQ